jgi:thiamine pyrophosphate-dependent acetolactate synthase large subunit-like protein
MMRASSFSFLAAIEHYILEISVVGDIATSLRALAERIPPRDESRAAPLRRKIDRETAEYAESFSARGFRVESAEQLAPVMEQALDCGTVAVVDCPVDYSENMKLTEKLGELVCPIGPRRC